MRTLPSIHAGGAGSGSGSGRYSSSGSNSMTLVRGCTGIPNEDFRSVLTHYSSTRDKYAFFQEVVGAARSVSDEGEKEPLHSTICCTVGHGIDYRSAYSDWERLMLVVMQSHASEEQVRAVCQRIERLGLKAHRIPGTIRPGIGI